MKLGIDASNLRSGGGVTHLVELLRAANPTVHGFLHVVVWASHATLSRLDDRLWLLKRHDPVLEKNYIHRALWQRNRLGVLAKEEHCNLLFIPGGSFATDFRPVVTMSQNMLPFDWKEMRRYGLSKVLLKLLLLRSIQSNSFRKADGLIFLTEYAQAAVSKVINKQFGVTAVIPHGIDRRFFSSPRPQKRLEDFTDSAPCRILYVSHIEPYKHQWNVAEAISKLKSCNFQVQLNLVGPEGNAIRRLRKTLDRLDPDGEFIIYRGAVPYEELHNFYAETDINVYASSCENMPNIVLEAMASGLPIACSNKGPMPEVLGDAGFYFDPEKPDDIAHALQTLLTSTQLRGQMAHASFARAQVYSWKDCSRETFDFLKSVALS
jgi:glycosyltransferase involved in cell wall biosynthesis